jgi:FAD synthase
MEVINNISFTAHIVKGEGKGTELGTPTLNLDLSEVPSELKEGVYAVYADRMNGAMFYGERGTMELGRSCEVHLLERSVISDELAAAKQSEDGRSTLSVEVVEKIRDVEKFETEDLLKEQIAEDIEKAKNILDK